MSLAIDVDQVTAVLLADGWHEVADQSFTMDAYEYLWWHDATRDPKSRHYGEPTILHGGGQGGICSTGFQFREGFEGKATNSRIAGPLTAILAVRHTGKRGPE